MKIQSPNLLLAVTTSLCLFFTGCSKVFDYIDHHPGSVASCCRIDSLTINTFAHSRHIKVNYNAAGNPISMLDPGNAGYMYVNFYFRYDKYNRLTDYIVADPPSGLAYSWTRYFYPSSRIIIDSSFEYQGRVTDPHPVPPYYQLTTGGIELDNKGRAIKGWTRFRDYSQPDTVVYNTVTNSITYDSRGNAVIPGVVYDDKVNIFQTNKVWQLVFGDYSRNNPYTPATGSFPGSIPSYNAYGLPHEFLSFNTTFGSDMLGYTYTDMFVSYSCDSSKILQPAY